jgi:hypothetical protein
VSSTSPEAVGVEPTETSLPRRFKSALSCILVADLTCEKCACGWELHVRWSTAGPRGARTLNGASVPGHACCKNICFTAVALCSPVLGAPLSAKCAATPARMAAVCHGIRRRWRSAVAGLCLCNGGRVRCTCLCLSLRFGLHLCLCRSDIGGALVGRTTCGTPPGVHVLFRMAARCTRIDPGDVAGGRPRRQVRHLAVALGAACARRYVVRVACGTYPALPEAFVLGKIRRIPSAASL